VAKKKKKEIEEVEVKGDETMSSEDLIEAGEAVEKEEVELEEEKVEATVIEEVKEPTLEEQLAMKNNEVKDYVDRLQRSRAEFDNFRKRSIKEKSQMYERGAKEVLDKLLPVVDNFERAMKTATEEHQEDPFVQGIDMIYKQVLTLLDELGVKEIEALNQPFNPDLHHAVQHDTSDDHEESQVVEVYQKGYRYKETVLRYSMVKVVN